MNSQKKVQAVAPYIHPEFLNFKMAAYNAWKACGGETAPGHYPWRAFHGLTFRHELPPLFHSRGVIRLRFVEPISISFDAFPDYITHEVIPFVWDCWPRYFDKMEKWLKKHKVRTAIFTSSQEMKEMQQRCPEIKMLWCSEAVNTSSYKEGKRLNDRSIDLLEFGRGLPQINTDDFKTIRNFKHIRTKEGEKFLYSESQLYELMVDAKVTICLPRSMTHPEMAGGIETLTQRYWEAMLSRMVIVGHAPKELVDVCGYNPCIELEDVFGQGGFESLLNHIEDYQDMVDRNREVALEKGDWNRRMKDVQSFLREQGYLI